MRRAALMLGVLAPFAVQAAQFVVLDISYTHAGTGSEPSHKHVPPPYPGGVTPPSNWTSPIDYAHGKAHFRLEVKTKPSSVVVNYETCFVQPTGYGCMGAYGFTKPGVYEWEKSLPQMWQYTALDWSKNAVQSEIAMVVKDANYNKIETFDPNLYPMELRYTVTIVSAGSAYVPPALDAGTPPVADAGQRADAGLDAGAPTAVPDAGFAVDAGHPVDPPLVDAGPSASDAGAASPVPEPTGPTPPVSPHPEPDAGVPSMSEATPNSGPVSDGMGGCSVAGAGTLPWLLLAVAFSRARRLG